MTATVLLTENIHDEAVDVFTGASFPAVERLAGALDEAQLRDRIGAVDLIGVRSRTHLPASVFAAGSRLLAAGCFSIGTNQVDLDAAAAAGVPVFNSPFANSRSVAELTLACAILLLRRIPERMFELSRGIWTKTAEGAFEARAKKLGIVGYGNIGSQLSVLASGLGMHVYYFDIDAKLRHGNARPLASLDELLETCDVVTLHTPDTPATRGMIDRRAIGKMKPGAILINHARGGLVDIDALAEALAAGRLAGAAIDVFPEEPASGKEPFTSRLRDLQNVILSPHIGGSTQEAQVAIGREVAEKLVRYWREGSTTGAVNFPETGLGPLRAGRRRIAHVHRNVPGVLGALNDAVGRAGLNIAGQSLATASDLGYALMDLEGAPPPGLLDALSAAPGTIRARWLPAID